MAKYRKRPVVIEAVQLGPHAPAPDWLKAAFALGTKPGGVASFDAGIIRVYTLEGVMTAEAGDWIIKGVKGELYPCKPDIFAATYEPADG